MVYDTTHPAPAVALAATSPASDFETAGVADALKAQETPAARPFVAWIRPPLDATDEAVPEAILLRTADPDA
jgi:hypothetical protein